MENGLSSGGGNSTSNTCLVHTRSYTSGKHHHLVPPAHLEPFTHAHTLMAMPSGQFGVQCLAHFNKLTAGMGVERPIFQLGMTKLTYWATWLFSRVLLIYQSIMSWIKDPVAKSTTLTIIFYFDEADFFFYLLVNSHFFLCLCLCHCEPRLKQSNIKGIICSTGSWMQTRLYRFVSNGGEGYKSYMLTGICEIL